MEKKKIELPSVSCEKEGSEFSSKVNCLISSFAKPMKDKKQSEVRNVMRTEVVNNRSMKSTNSNWSHSQIYKYSSKNLFPKNAEFNILNLLQKTTKANEKCEHPSSIEGMKAVCFEKKNRSFYSPEFVCAVSNCLESTNPDKQFEREMSKIFAENNNVGMDKIKNTFHEEKNNKEMYTKTFNNNNLSKHFLTKKLEKENCLNKINKEKNISSFHEGPLTNNAFKINIKTGEIKDNTTTQEFFFKNKPIVSNKQYTVPEYRREILELSNYLTKEFSKCESPTLPELLNFRDTILNYGLSSLLSHIGDRCREEAHLFDLLFKTSFRILESVISLLASECLKREEEQTIEELESQKIYQTNHDFLIQKGNQIQNENIMIMEKMKKVILWNKQLRRERRKQAIELRLMKYRNFTYSAALENTIEMMLTYSREPITLTLAKQVISKLLREKRRKDLQRLTVDMEVEEEARTVVYRWLRGNSLIDDDTDNKINLLEIEDNLISEQIDIYDFFKIIDVGTQTQAKEVKNYFVQCEKNVCCNVGINTEKINIADKNIQTVQINDSQVIKNSNNNKSQYEKSKNRKDSIKINKQINISTNKKIKENNITSFQEKFENKKEERRKNISLKKEKETKKIENISEEKEERDYKKGRMTEKSKDVEISKSRKSMFVGSLKQASYERRNSDAKQERRNSIPEDFNEIDVFNELNNSNELLLDGKSNFFLKKDQKAEISLVKAYSHRRGSLKFIRAEKVPTNNFIAIKNIKKHKNSFNTTANENILNTAAISNLYDKSDRLENKKFAEVYPDRQQQLKENPKLFVERIIRRRSFYKKNKVFYNESSHTPLEDQEKNLITPDHAMNLQEKINKKHNAAFFINLSKSKASVANSFAAIANTIIVPKLSLTNKNFVVNSIQNLIRQVCYSLTDFMKREDERICYPLRVLVMEYKIFKYGLKDIAEKKTRHFIEKILCFAPVSERINLYSLLLGLQNENVGADELLVYVRCLMHLDPAKAKDPTIDKPLELESTAIQKIVEQFINKENVDQVMTDIMALNKCANVENVSFIIIKALLRIKKETKKIHCGVYALCNKSDNFFAHLLRLMSMMEFYNEHVEENEIISKQAIVIKELMKRCDQIDENTNKLLSEDRFISACVVLNVPNINQLEEINKKTEESINYIGLEEEFVGNKLKKKAEKWGIPLIEGFDSFNKSRVFIGRTESEIEIQLGMLGVLKSEIDLFLFTI